MALKPKETLSRNLGLFTKMRGLAERQAEVLADEDIDQFLDLASKRTQLQQEISRNQRNFKERSAEGQGRSSDPHRRSIADELSEVIQSIREIDRKIELFIHEKKAGFLSEIKKMRRGQRAVKNYEGKPLRRPKFFDREG